MTTPSLLTKISAAYRLHGGTLRNTTGWAVMTYHFGVWSKERRFPPLRALTGGVYSCLALAVEVASGITIDTGCVIGEDLHLVHSGNIKIDAGVRIGNGVGIMHGVTIAAANDRPGLPVIGDNVYIGTGATILGPVVIGKGARIASNSLVLDDVPPETTAVGVPARVLRYTGRPAAGSTPAAASSAPVSAAPVTTPPAGARTNAEAVDA